MFALLFMSDETKHDNILELMEYCDIEKTDCNYNKISSYYDLLLDIKKEFLEGCN